MTLYSTAPLALTLKRLIWAPMSLIFPLSPISLCSVEPACGSLPIFHLASKILHSMWPISVIVPGPSKSTGLRDHHHQGMKLHSSPGSSVVNAGSCSKGSWSPGKTPVVERAYFQVLWQLHGNYNECVIMKNTFHPYWRWIPLIEGHTIWNMSLYLLRPVP